MTTFSIHDGGLCSHFPEFFCRDCHEELHKKYLLLREKQTREMVQNSTVRHPQFNSDITLISP